MINVMKKLAFTHYNHWVWTMYLLSRGLQKTEGPLKNTVDLFRVPDDDYTFDSDDKTSSEIVAARDDFVDRRRNSDAVDIDVG